MTARASERLLTDRERLILIDLARVRLLSGAQLDRLHFDTLTSPRSRASSRRRTMERLIDQRLVTTLPRRVGGERAGSAGLIYTLDAAGQRFAEREAWLRADSESTPTARKPWPIGQLFVAHTLDVAELYVRLREVERAGQRRLLVFDAEPRSWHRSVAGQLKPDAYAVWRDGDWEEHRWIEVDRATESLPTLRRKLLTYIDAAAAGDFGPRGVLPRVLLTVPSPRRQAAATGLLMSLSPMGNDLVAVQLFSEMFVSTDPDGQQARPPP